MMNEKKGRRAKIVCTLGPAVASPTGMRNLVAAGMDVARLNFSHGTHPEHAQLYHWVRQAANEAGRSVGVLADLQGPKTCLVTEGGVVSDNKGISLPEVDIRAATFSDKDAADLRFALTLGADMVALSFVRDADDVTLAREVVASMGRSVGILAKIETPQAVKKLADITASFDGLMIARADLGVELPLEQVPLIQKRGISLSRKAGKPVIVATQMLESMVSRPRPTRAEVSDVANAVLDGADALMLSAETSVGQNPDSAVATMARVIA